MTTYDRKVRQPAAQTGLPTQPAGSIIKPRVPAGGPLTRLVREAQRQQPTTEQPATQQPGPQIPGTEQIGAAKGGTNWTEVAQALTTKYHELEGKVTTGDLLGAIRELPDDGIQDLVINNVGGTHAEQLKQALRSPAPQAKAPAPLSQFRAVTPGASSDAKSAPSQTPAATPATEKAAAKGKINPAKAPVEAKTSPKGKRTEKTAAKKDTDKKTAAKATPRTALKKNAASPQTLNGTAKSASHKQTASGSLMKAAAGHASGKESGGAQGGNGNLIVARRDEFKGLNVKLNPSMERGGKLVFSPTAWRAAEKGVQQALKQREALNARKLQDTPGQPQRAIPHQLAQAKRPVKVPSATIKAAEIKKHEQQNRQKNQAKLKSVVAKANKARADIAKAQPKATAQITAAQKSAEATISAALQKTLGQIRTAEASARSTVTARGSAATSKVNSAHQATVQGIRQDTTQKIASLKQAAQAQKTQLTAQKTKLDSSVTTEFNTTSTAIQGIGQSQAGSARSTGQSFAARYRAEPLPEQNALQKLANGDNYYADKRAAKVQAALDVSSSYASEMTKAGNEQATKIMQSLPDALASNQTILTEYQKQLNTYLNGQVTALQTQQENAITQANQQHSSLIAQINAQKTQALSSIAQAAAQGRSQATSQANSKKQAVRTQGQQAVKGVASSVKQAQTQMQGRIQSFQKDVQGKLTLDAPEFAKAVSGFEGYAQKGGSQAQAQVTRTASTSAARVKASAAPAAQALTGLGQSTSSSLKTQGTQTGAALTALASSGATGLKQALTGHQQATKAALTSANTQLKSFGESFGKDSQKVVTDVKTQLGKTEAPFQTALGDALGKEPGDIEAAANKAADAIQPRWKSVLKVVIDVVIVVATIAATVALAAVLGPVGLVLAGMAIGALGAVVGQGLKDAVDGKFSGWEAYGAAALGGAIGGAFGGAGGAVGNILAKGAMKGITSGFAKGAMRVGVEGVVGTGFDLAGQVATGYTNQAVFNQPYKLSDTFNAKNIAMTGVMNTAGTALASPSAVKFVSGKLGNINIPGKGLLGKFQNTLANSRPIQAINKLDNKITSSKIFTNTSARLERAGEIFGTGVSKGGNTVKTGTVKAGQFAGEKATALKNTAQQGYQNVKDWTGQKANQVKSTAQDFTAWSKGKLNDASTYVKGRPDAMRDWLKANGKTNLKAAIKEMALGSLKKPGINQISNYLFDGKFGPITDAAKEAVEGGVKGAGKGASKDPKLPDDAPAPTKKQQAWKVTKDTLIGAGSGVVAKFINNLTFTGRIGSSAEYLISAVEGGLAGAGGRLSDISSTALLKAVMKENTNRYVKVLGKFASDSGLKSVFDFGMKNLANVANGNLFGSAYTWKNLLSGKEIVKVLANSGKFANLGKDLLPLVKADLKRAGNALSEWKTQQWTNLKGHLDTLGTKASSKINDIKDYAGGKYDAARTRMAEITGSKQAPIKETQLDATDSASGRISKQDGHTTVGHHPNATPQDRQLHMERGLEYRRDHSPIGRTIDWAKEKLGGMGNPPVKTEGYYFKAEVEKIGRQADIAQQKLEKMPLGPERDALQNDLAAMRNAEQNFKDKLAQLDGNGSKVNPQVVEGQLKYPDVNAAAKAKGMPEPPEGHYYREVPRGKPPYQLQAFPGKAGALAEIDSRYRVVEKNGKYELEANTNKPLTYDDRVNQRLEAYRDNQYFNETRLRYPDLDEGLASCHALYEDRLRTVLGDKVPPRFFDEMMQTMSTSSLRGDAWESLYRQKLRECILRNVDECIPGQQYQTLHEWLGAQPNNGAKGSLFQAYQERNLPDGMLHIKPEQNDTSMFIVGQDGVPYRAKADTITDVVQDQGRHGPKSGKYLVEDKSGQGAFDEEQFKKYVEMIEKGDLETLSGKRFDGLIYFFDSKSAYSSAEAFLKNHPKLGEKLHVAYLNENAKFEWISRQRD